MLQNTHLIQFWIPNTEKKNKKKPKPLQIAGSNLHRMLICCWLRGKFFYYWSKNVTITSWSTNSEMQWVPSLKVEAYQSSCWYNLLEWAKKKLWKVLNTKCQQLLCWCDLFLRFKSYSKVEMHLLSPNSCREWHDLNWRDPNTDTSKSSVK